MPGHKRNGIRFPYLKHFADIDITEIEGFDNLHNASGILKLSMENAAKERGANAAFYLVNGSTCGILAAVCAVLKQGDKVIMARNCHKSVYNGIELAGAEPIFVYPAFDNQYGIAGSVNPLDIDKSLGENPDARLVIVTSPTYEGVISDIEKICEIAHKRNVPVLVDAAHGAHLGYYGFSKDAVRKGADICVESLHKTLPSLTQSAICYLSGKLVSQKELSEKLAVFETSSPSYILLSSIDGCINTVNENERKIFGAWNEKLDYFYKKTIGLKNIEILRDGREFFDLDRSKLVIFPKNQSGEKLAKFLRSQNIEPEMVTPYYIICMTGAGEKKRSLKKLINALFKADKKENEEIVPQNIMEFGDMQTEFRDALKSDKVFCSLKDAEGRISAGYVWVYPPGVPVLVPGERISQKLLDALGVYEKNGTELCGNIEDGKILVIK